MEHYTIYTNSSVKMKYRQSSSFKSSLICLDKRENAGRKNRKQVPTQCLSGLTTKYAPFAPSTTLFYYNSTTVHIVPAAAASHDDQRSHQFFKGSLARAIIIYFHYIASIGRKQGPTD